ARAATDRLVGVALGGGGALGLAHVPLLRAIDEAGIPIDIVSGASFGSLVGAYYCMNGGAGLDRLERNVRRLTRGPNIRGFILPQTVLRLIDQPMKDARLESLPVQFVPVATYASDFTPALPAAATVAEAVRASGAMPPLFAAHDGDGMRFLDGAFVANVPAEVLVACGAALVIASDPISQPAAEAARRSDGRLARIADAIGRMGVFRLTDFGRGLQTLVHLASAQSSLTGDVLFRPPRASLIDTFRFGQCAEIIDASQQAIERTGLVRRAQAAWGQLCGHERVVPQTAEG
ncbi:MAG: patatin-like phospholipase family protein, partial [Myxococcales bacterium]|nr:patatin-like phospholipase family protein [Myxococcales bacterium]